MSGLITQVSPIKKNSKKNANVRYFNGQISDGKQTARIICFDPSLHQTVDQALKNRSSISFVNCQVKPNVFDKQLEVVATTSRIYTVPTENFEDKTSSKQISISELSDLSTTALLQVDITIKVLSIDPSTTVNKNDGSKVTKQDCIISDSTGTCRLVLWETDVEKLVQGQSYQIKVASVRIFKDTKYLSISANCTFSEVANIGVVKEPSDDEDNAKFKDVVGEIDTVLSSEQYYSCKSCKSKLQQDGVFAKCPKCSSLAKISNCTMVSTARVIIGDIDGNDHIVSLFEPILTDITKSSSGRTLSEKQLSCPKMKFTIHRRKVAVSVTKLED